MRTSQSLDVLNNKNNDARNSNDEETTTTTAARKNLGDFSEFYIFDPESEMYISIGEAFLKGIIILIMTICKL